MPIATETLVAGDLTLGTPSLEAVPESCVSPEWHTLRLFGGGRHPGAFAAGAEMRDEL
jgi:hypothetical protein